ncbi:protein SENSITIVE TO PROTON RHIZOTOXICITY 2-like [Syzygium oleosum]|uniref:protein SENSITIVE TO PROTON RHIZOTOXICITY 2-like n=1 Tax=Syzygium oleosum TaxID=219896 RepID=UPI0024B9C966|nr:protein SENSITIVE TO PROTON RHIZOTOXICITY 2-like [Syzygium oleosum]
MILDPASCGFASISQGMQMMQGGYNQDGHVLASNSGGAPPASASEAHSSSLLYSLSLLKDKVHQVRSLVTILVGSGRGQPESTSFALASMGSLIQEIIGTATSMMFSCQQMTLLGPAMPSGTTTSNDNNHHPPLAHEHSSLDWYSPSSFVNFNGNNDGQRPATLAKKGGSDQEMRELPQVDRQNNEKPQAHRALSSNSYDIIELNADDLLAKFTHYCQICGKGFKRDANLRMHMRAHGDEYKTSAALSNPTKNSNSNRNKASDDQECLRPKKYSCPQEGCRWNRKHPKFQPLKSMICVKNHYKRSHCPKMYVCKRCNRKQFSVLSDLRTHEKHCGDTKWQCNCGTTFSRKDKLMGHVTLFVGHSPALSVDLMNPQGLRVQQKVAPNIMQLDGIAYDRG